MVSLSHIIRFYSFAELYFVNILVILYLIFQLFCCCLGVGDIKPQSHTVAQARANAESNTQLGSSLNKSGRLTVKSFVSWDQKREVARQGKQACLYLAILLS